MSRHYDSLLREICQNNDTFRKAKSLLNTASIKTTHGSGYELGQGASGLPAICAYLAAEELGDTDIDENNAQISSCLKPNVFQTTLNIVRSALTAASTSPMKHSRTVTYNQLVVEKKIGRKSIVVDWMQNVEKTLMSNREMRRRFGSAYDVITVAIFCWTLQLMKKENDPVTLLDKCEVPRDLYDEVTDALHDLCGENAKMIEADIASLRVETANAKANKSKIPLTTDTPAIPSPLRFVTKSHSKSALRAPSVDLSPNKTPSHKRKVAFDAALMEEDEAEFDALATPSKRQKFSSPVKPLDSSLTPRASSRLAAAVTASASKTTERAVIDLQPPNSGPSTPRRQKTAASQPSSTHSSRSARSSRSLSVARGSTPLTPRRKPTLPTVREEEEVTRRRYRPVFADQQQWIKGDARLEREMKPWAEKWRGLVREAGGDVWKAAGMVGNTATVAS